MNEGDFSGSWVWTTDRTSALINLYKRYPFLYNTKLPEYKDKDMRNEAWEHIGKQIGTTGHEISKKVRGLRTQYAREKVKQVTKGGDKARFISTWGHYNALRFLDEFTTMKNKQTNEWSIDYNSEIEAYNEHIEMNSMNPTAYVFEDDVKTEVEDCVIVENVKHVSQDGRAQDQSQAAVAYNLRQAFPSMARGVKRKLLDFDKATPQRGKLIVANVSESREENSVSSSQEAPEGEERSHDDDNNDELFVKYIASELRQIRDIHVKRIVKHNIQNIIFEAHCSLQDKT